MGQISAWRHGYSPFLRANTSSALQVQLTFRKMEPTILILILILQSHPPRWLVEIKFSLRQWKENTQRTRTTSGWLVYDEDINGNFCRVHTQTISESATQHTGGVRSQNHSNWKKAIKGMKAHGSSCVHTQASHAKQSIPK